MPLVRVLHKEVGFDLLNGITCGPQFRLWVFPQFSLWVYKVWVEYYHFHSVASVLHTYMKVECEFKHKMAF